MRPVPYGLLRSKAQFLFLLARDASVNIPVPGIVCAQPSDFFLDLFGRFVPSRPDFEMPCGFAPLIGVSLFSRPSLTVRA